MLLTASENQAGFGTAVIVIILGFAAIYAFGYIRAVMHRAGADYRKTKAGLPDMRKAYWSAWWVATKRGVVIALIVIASVWIWFRGNTSSADATPGPVPSATRHT